MIRRFVLLSLLAGATSILCAASPTRSESSGDEAAHVSNEAEDRYQALVAAMEAEDARIQAHNEAVQATDEYQKAREADDRETLDALRKEMERIDYKPFVERAMAGAKQFAGTEGAIDFLGLTAQRGKGDQVRGALAKLQLEHLASAKLEEWVGRAGWYVRPTDSATVLGFLRAVDQGNKHDKVRANAIYQIYRVTSRDRDATQEAKDVAAARLPEAANLAGEGELRDRIQAPIFEKERLQIGMVAPDIEGSDLDGVSFKLSDYRGKVVVLDFWGDW